MLMEFDFSKYKRFLSRNDLGDCIHLLSKHPDEVYKRAAGKLGSQIRSLQNASKLPFYPNRAVDKGYRLLIKSFYQTGRAAHIGEKAPAISTLPVWRPIIFRYGLIALLLGSTVFGWMALTTAPVCPKFSETAKVRIMIDAFATSKPTIFEKLGFPSFSQENLLKRALQFNDTEVLVHPVHVSNKERARAFCDTCRAQFIIYGKEYGFNDADLEFVIDNESYNYLIGYKDSLIIHASQAASFKVVRDSSNLNNLTCTIRLIRGLQSKALYEKNKLEDDAEKILNELEREFTLLKKEGCITSTSMMAFIDHCRAWASLKLLDTNTAIAIYDTILKEDPGNILALNNNARLLEAKNRYAEAEIKYDVLLSKVDNPVIRNSKMNVLIKQGKTDEAKKESKIINETIKITEDQKASNKFITVSTGIKLNHLQTDTTSIKPVSSNFIKGGATRGVKSNSQTK